MKRSKIAALVAGGVLGCDVPAFAQNAVTNSNFTADVSGWSQAGIGAEKASG